MIRKHLNRFACLALLASAAVQPALAQNDNFHRGTVITEFGPIATIDADMAIPDGTRFDIAFDISKAAEPGDINRSFVSAARFINMQVEAGVPAENIRIALVVHGGASLDLLQHEIYAKRKGLDSKASLSPNVAAIQTLLKHNVRIILCGQSAAAHDIEKDQLVPGVEMALSAMTAHALLQQQGFTLNPF